MERIHDGQGLLAEAVRFELTRGVNPCRFSRPVQSTTLPRFLFEAAGLSTAVGRMITRYKRLPLGLQLVSPLRSLIRVTNQSLGG